MESSRPMVSQRMREILQRTTPATADLVSYWGGRHRLLRVREVAEQLGVCNATVYRLVETGDLPHVRIVNVFKARRTGSMRLALRHRMALEELPHHRTCFEVGDSEHGPAPGSAVAVLGPAMAHSGDRAEHDFGALATSSVRHAPRRTHVVRLHGRRAATVAHDPAVDVW